MGRVLADTTADGSAAVFRLVIEPGPYIHESRLGPMALSEQISRALVDDLADEIERLGLDLGDVLAVTTELVDRRAIVRYLEVRGHPRNNRSRTIDVRRGQEVTHA